VDFVVTMGEKLRRVFTAYDRKLIFISTLEGLRYCEISETYARNAEVPVGVSSSNNGNCV
jgi:hypothetical protein